MRSSSPSRSATVALALTLAVLPSLAKADTCDENGSGTSDGAETLVGLRDSLPPRPCGPAALPNGGTIRTSRMPAQWPASRIGAPIARFIPADATVVEHAVTSGSSPQETHWLDANGDGAYDLRVTTTTGASGPRRSVDFTQPDGTRVLLWEGENGRVDWEQRGWPGEPFENSFDRNDDGVVDDLRTGCPDRPTTIYLLDPSATDRSARSGGNALGVDPSMLQMPHAIVPESDPMQVTWYEDIERADVRVRLDLGATIPPLSPELLARVTGVKVTGNWLAGGGRATVTRDGNTLLIEATNVDGAIWLGKAPILRLAVAGQPEKLVALVSPKALVDDTVSELAAERHSAESVRKQLAILRESVASAERNLANVVTRWDGEIARRKEALAAADVRIAETRPSAADSWNAATPSARLRALEALAAAGTTTPAEGASAAALLERARGEGAPSAAGLDPAVADLALAFHENARDPESGFVAALVESRQLRLEDLPYYEGLAATERAENEAYWEQRLEYATGAVAELEVELAEREARIGAFEAGERSRWTATTTHEPYTFENS